MTSVLFQFLQLARRNLSRAVVYRIASVLLLVSLAQPQAYASPWLEADDADLRQSLLTLANAGLITVPVNTYPLPWRAIMADVEALKVQQLSPHLQFAVNHLRHYLYQAQYGAQTSIMVSGHSEELPLADFGSAFYERGNIAVQRNFIGTNWAARLQVNRRFEPFAEDQDTTFDGSFLAAKLGDWVVSVDALPLWWGPGQDSALVMSTNARPLEKVQLSQFRSKPLPWTGLDWLGPLSFTTFVARLDPDRRDVEDSYLWGARLTSRPFAALEFGLSHALQFGGDKLDPLTNQSTPVNRNNLLGIDARYSFSNYYGTGAVYAEVASDTAASLADSAWLVGMEWHQGDANVMQSWFIELTDTLAACQRDATRAGNCLYEHVDYEQGYRHFEQSIGSQYDTDTKALTLGFRWYDSAANGWQGKLRYIQFNRDDSQPTRGGHPYFAQATERQQIDVGRIQGLFGGLLKINLQSWRDQPRGQAWQDVEWGGSISWEWRF